MAAISTVLNAPNTPLELVKPTCCDIIQSLALLAFGAIPTLILYGLAYAASHFDCELSKGLQSLAIKVHTLVLLHPLSNLNCLTVSESLTFSKNLATQEVIWNGEDVLMGKEYLEKLHLSQYPNFGAHSDGICYGATLYLIKELLTTPVEDEAALVKVVGKYYRGFPAEASAMQTAHDTLIDHYMPKYRALVKLMDEETNVKEKLRILQQSEALLDEKEKQLSTLYALFNLKDRSNTTLSEIGHYQLTKDHHATLFLNYPFGTYLFDPNWGLWSNDPPTNPQDYKINSFEL